MTNIVQQCIAWNAARYDRVLNLEQALNLLTEETNELFAADNIIDKLDAVGDISFVAMGVLWKAGVPESIIAEIIGIDSETNANNFSNCSTLLLYGTHSAISLDLPDLVDSSDAFIAVNAALLGLWYCVFELKRIGLQQEYFNIVKAICDSNDTKEIKGKVDPSVKANIEKGSSYIPPTMSLKRIVAQYERVTVN